MIKYIILAIILLAILSFLGFNIRSFIESDIVQNNFGYVWNAVKYGWDNFLARPAEYLWNDVFVDLIWEPFISAMKKIKAGKSPDMIENTSKVLP